MTTLYLCEKPSQGRDIARVLGATGKAPGYIRGPDLVVTWCIGHLLEQAAPEVYDPAWARWDLDALPMIPPSWKLIVRKEGKAQYACIKKLLKTAKNVVLATDADREGESIGREVLQLCGYRGPIERLWLSALDEASIRKALGQLLPGEQTEPLYQAGLARARADWLVGLNLTRAYTLLGRQGGNEGVLSVGRVQTPTLKLVVDRDRAIEAFVPQPYYTVTAACTTTDSARFNARWIPAHSEVALDAEGRCTSEPAARNVAQSVAGRPAHVLTTHTERRREGPPLPFDLSTLQQEASRRFGLDAQETLRAAQALYETHKATTYPRTDCGYLPLSQHADAPAVLDVLAQSEPPLRGLVQNADTYRLSRAWNDGKITAHHGIVPTARRIDLGRLAEPERKLYELIRARYLAQFFADFEYDQTTVELECSGHRFRAQGRSIRDTGWRVVINGEARSDTNENETADTVNEPQQSLPRLAEYDTVTVVDSKCHARTTKPPPCFTSGTLIAAMKSIGQSIADPKLKSILRETSGFGTEATRASIIQTLIDRGFIAKRKRALVSTPTGRALIDAVPADVANPATTALWEQALEDIANGRGDLRQFMQRQQQFVEALIQQARKATFPVAAQPVMVCPDCGKPMRQRKGRHGLFWACSGFPTCTKTMTDHRGEPMTKSKAKNARR